MKVLVTGSAGFIFSNFIIYALQETKWDIVSIDKLTYAGSLLNISHNANVFNKRHRFYLGDVCDSHFVNNVFKIEKPDIVIHGAAESHVDRSIEDASVFIKTNVLGTHTMLEAALKVHTPDKFINVSTDEVYGSVLSGSSKEGDTMAPRSPYSSSKAGADLLGQSYFSTHNLPVITTRCCNVFGSRQDTEKFLPKVITNIIAEKEIPLYGDGLQERQWIYVKDKFRAIKAIIEDGIAGESYNISANCERRNIDLLNDVFSIMGRGTELVRNVKDRPGHDQRYSVDASKLNRHTGWEPAYEFNEALAHTIGWYKANTWSWK